LDSRIGLPECLPAEAAFLFGFYLAEFFNAHVGHFGIDGVEAVEGADEAIPETLLSSAGLEIARLTGKEGTQIVAGAIKKAQDKLAPTVTCVLSAESVGSVSDVVKLLRQWGAENKFSFELDGVVQSQHLLYTLPMATTHTAALANLISHNHEFTMTKRDLPNATRTAILEEASQRDSDEAEGMEIGHKRKKKRGKRGRGNVAPPVPEVVC